MASSISFNIFACASFSSTVPVDMDLDWKRLSDIYPNQKLFGDTLQLSTVKQGNLGDCYFLAALENLTNHPQSIKKLFVQPAGKANKIGIYQVQFYISGQLKSVVVDDYVPIDKVTKKLAFCRAINQEIWPLILEKAWAKLHGNYAKSIWGDPSFANIHLTNMPSKDIQHEEMHPDDIWKQLKESLNWNHNLIANGLLNDRTRFGMDFWETIKDRAICDDF